jgi:hypothetical protein
VSRERACTCNESRHVNGERVRVDPPSSLVEDLRKIVTAVLVTP